LKGKAESMDKSEIYQNLSDDGRKILDSIALNLLTQECYESLRGKLSNEPVTELDNIVGQDITNSIPMNLDEPTKALLKQRLAYWLTKERRVSWLQSLEQIGSRKSISRGRKANECAWPGCNNKTDLQLDHKFPYSLGGGEDSENIQTLCKWCNRIKGNNPLMIIQWPGESV